VIYQKKSWVSRLKEVMICLLFLRPAVDAYRVSTNHKDEEDRGYLGLACRDDGQ